MKPVFSVELWSALGRLSQPEFQRVREALQRVTQLPLSELTGTLREADFTVRYSYGPDGLLTFEGVEWTAHQG